MPEAQKVSIAAKGKSTVMQRTLLKPPREEMKTVRPPAAE
jgi:hypothetical protein